MTIKVGDRVALVQDHLWAPRRAVGVVDTIYTEWDADDMICWELGVFFPKDQLTAEFRFPRWFGKNSGLHFSDVVPMLGYCMHCHKAVIPSDDFDIGSRRSAILYWHKKDENGDCITN